MLSALATSAKLPFKYQLNKSNKEPFYETENADERKATKDKNQEHLLRAQTRRKQQNIGAQRGSKENGA